MQVVYSFEPFYPIDDLHLTQLFCGRKPLLKQLVKCDTRCSLQIAVMGYTQISMMTCLPGENSAATELPSPYSR